MNPLPRPASECSGCMQGCSGMKGSLYDPSNSPGTPFMCVNKLALGDSG